MPSWFGGDSSQAQNYEQLQSGNVSHQADTAHELIAGAASYEAAKAYEKHCSENGKPTSHAEAKELL
ncbi:hypothetical protein PHLCEN_2v12663 [Hermanssonia centrifuga]|nr:hypothetical protein PHLCEN_2v12663 [Hermanssonia centrifuga]